MFGNLFGLGGVGPIYNGASFDAGRLSQAQIDALNRQQHAQAQEAMFRQAEYLRQAQQHRPAPPPPRSKFDTPDVIDMVQDSDGVWREPALLEDRSRGR